MKSRTETLVCPFCNSLLALDEDIKMIKCEQNHSFDVAKEGYVNLLPVNKKNSLNPGDNSEMILARRSFLEEGFYHPLVERLAFILDEFEYHKALDVCCGEGYYTDRVFDESVDVLAFDISKSAIKYAAKKYNNQLYFVGSVFNLPIKPKSQDLILSIFTPISKEEFNKVLSDRGCIVVVSAHEDHMKEVAELIYGNFKRHSYHPNDKLGFTFDLVKEDRLTYTISLNSNSSLLNMLKMTPYYWSVDEVQKGKFEALESLKVTCDFRISVFRKGGEV